MKRSAGIFVYQIRNQQIYIFLAHMGGPYWKNINTWSILKGEYSKCESAMTAAVREFEEESGQKLDSSHLFYLHTEKQKSKKLVIFFATEGNIDSERCFSNTFQKEYPTKSGILCEFPEMDEYRWFPIEEAKKVILKGQKKALIKLENILMKKKSC